MLIQLNNGTGNALKAWAAHRADTSGLPNFPKDYRIPSLVHPRGAYSGPTICLPRPSGIGVCFLKAFGLVNGDCNLFAPPGGGFAAGLL